MTYPSMQPMPIPPVGPGELEDENDVNPPDADAELDSDGVPVGEDDHQADIDRSSEE